LADIAAAFVLTRSPVTDLNLFTANESPSWTDPAGGEECVALRDLADALQMVQDAVLVVTSADLRIISANASACRLLGMAPYEVPFRKLSQYIPAATADACSAAVEEAAPLRTHVLDGQGKRIPVRLHIRNSRVRNDVWIVVGRDLRPLERLVRMSRTGAHCDPLTGLPNRAACRARLQFLISQGAPAFVVLFIDLDRFKQVNDRFGHLVGDQVLSAVARRIARCSRAGDLIARYGGDEFVAVIENCSGPSLERIIRRIQKEIARPIRIEGAFVRISATIGFGRSGNCESTVDELLATADRDLYRMKCVGRQSRQPDFP
jgi:diguanylate cyclase (GGDEF)-like protein